MTFPETGDHCIDFFGEAWNRKAIAFPKHARVLEIGSAEGDWQTPMRQVRPDLHIVGIDVRDTPHADDIKGDVLSHEFEPESFDAAVSISAMEHVGLGAYGDPTEKDGDIRAAERIVSWIKPHGLWYFDVPYGETFAVTKQYRRYRIVDVATRLTPYCILTSYKIHKVNHADSPYIACVCQKA